MLTGDIGNVDVSYSVRSRDTDAAYARYILSQGPASLQTPTYKAPTKKIQLNDAFDFLDI